MNRAERRTLKSRSRQTRYAKQIGDVMDLFKRDSFGAPLAIGWIPGGHADEPETFLVSVAEWANVSMGNHSPSDLICFAYDNPVDDGLALELLPRARTIAALIARGYQDRVDKIAAIGGPLSIPFIVCTSNGTTYGALDVHPLTRGGTA
jgi:hypothetical protein